MILKRYDHKGAEIDDSSLIHFVGYVRISSQVQKDKDGPDRQIEAIKVFAAQYDNVVVDKIFVEDISGTTNAIDRPIWMEMIAYAEENGIKHIAIEFMDRFTRDLGVGNVMIQNLIMDGMTLYFAKTHVNVTESVKHNPEMELSLNIQGSIAQYDRKKSVLRLNRGRAKAKKERWKCGGRSSTAEMCPELHWTVWWLYEELCDEYIKKTPVYRMIAQILNDSCQKTMTGKDFSVNSVKSMLRVCPLPYHIIKLRRVGWRPYPEF
jgi:DNA invertase Pin-like site-specific DNA recombinase